jgi:hypothetical protein
MEDRPVSRFLLQEQKGQAPHLYAWTPTLAQRNDMRQITPAEARALIKGYREEEEKQKQGRLDAEVEVAESKKNTLTLEESYPDRDLKPAIDKLDAIGEKEVFEDGALASQEDLLSAEIKKINGFKKASSLEEYVLKKYRISLLPRDLDDMKADAKVAMSGLSKEQKLYKLVG